MVRSVRRIPGGKLDQATPIGDFPQTVADDDDDNGDGEKNGDDYDEDDNGGKQDQAPPIGDFPQTQSW